MVNTKSVCLTNAPQAPGSGFTAISRLVTRCRSVRRVNCYFSKQWQTRRANLNESIGPLRISLVTNSDSQTTDQMSHLDCCRALLAISSWPARHALTGRVHHLDPTTIRGKTPAILRSTVSTRARSWLDPHLAGAPVIETNRNRLLCKLARRTVKPRQRVSRRPTLSEHPGPFPERAIKHAEARRDPPVTLR